jgi:hypothetical protein
MAAADIAKIDRRIFFIKGSFAFHKLLADCCTVTAVRVNGHD